MTALDKYQRLESTGLWRASPEAQRRDVIVSLGNATLVLTDRNETALAHWSLAALRRVNPRRLPALYSPDPDGIETLEIEDDLMIRSIEKVIGVIARDRPHPGRLRLAGVLIVGALVLATLVFWLPRELARHATSVVPDVTRTQIGDQLLVSIQRLSGRPCRSAPGLRALNALRRRVAPGMRRLVVLRSGVAGTWHLPGGIILLSRSLVEDHETPEATAGYVAAERLRFEGRDPLERLLRTAGPVTTVRLLTSGRISDEALATYAEHLLTAPPDPLDHEAVIAGFAEIGISTVPYAYALDISGEMTLPLIEADALRATPHEPVLSDEDWGALQDICSS